MNTFEKLRKEGEPYSLPVESYKTYTVSQSNDETVSVLTAQPRPDVWVAGWSIFWKDGRQSYHAPCLSDGYFSSERDARLYILGMFSSSLHSFTPDNAAAVRSAMGALQQYSLFN